MPARRFSTWARRAAAPLGPFLLLLTLACSPDRSAATISAAPNPVPPADAAPGTTTIAWDTTDGSWGQVYLFVAGQPEALFTEGPRGTQQAPWINGDAVYEFRLYAGKNREVLLDSVKVARGVVNAAADVSVFVLWHYAALAALVVMAYGFGRRLTRWCEYGSAWEQFVFCTGLGLGVTALLLFALGVMGVLYRSVVVAGITLLVVACGEEWKQLFSAFVRLPARTKGYAGLAAVTSALVLLPVLLLPLYPPTAFDALMYHLPYASSYVESHKVSPVLAARYPVFPQVNEMLFTLALLLVDDVAAQLTQFLMMVLVTLTLYAWGSRRYSPRVGLLAASLWLASPVVLQLAGYAYIDIGLALFATLSAYALFGALSGDRLGGSILAGAFAGLAAGSKYSGLIFVAALGLTALALTVRQRNLRYVIGFGVAVLATGAPWYIYNAYHSGNPFFPFLGQLFGSGFWDPEDTGYINTLIESYGTGDSLGSLVRLPWALSFGNFAQKNEISPIFFGSLPVLLFAAAVWNRVRSLVLLSVAFILFWFWTAAIVRYLLPILPVLSLAIAAVFDALLLRVPFRSGRPRAILTGACALVLVVPAWASAARSVDGTGLPPATQQARDAYLRRLVSYRSYQFMNTSRGSDYTLYALYGEGMLYYAKGRSIGDCFGQARFSRILRKLSDGQSLYRELRQLGAGYFLVRNEGGCDHVSAVKLPDDQFFRTHFKLVHDEPKVRLFELTDGPVSH